MQFCAGRCSRSIAIRQIFYHDFADTAAGPLAGSALCAEDLHPSNDSSHWGKLVLASRRANPHNRGCTHQPAGRPALHSSPLTRPLPPGTRLPAFSPRDQGNYDEDAPPTSDHPGCPGGRGSCPGRSADCFAACHATHRAGRRSLHRPEIEGRQRQAGRPRRRRHPDSPADARPRRPHSDHGRDQAYVESNDPAKKTQLVDRLHGLARLRPPPGQRARRHADGRSRAPASATTCRKPWPPDATGTASIAT